MSHIAKCVTFAHCYCAKTAETIEVSLVYVDSRGPKETYIKQGSRSLIGRCTSYSNC